MKTINDLINHVIPMLEYEVHAIKVVVADESINGIDGIDGDTTITLERRGSDLSWRSWIDVTITAQSINYEAMLAQSDTYIEKVLLAEFTIQEDPTETLGTWVFRYLQSSYPELHGAGLNYDEYSTVITITKKITLSGDTYTGLDDY
jgi:hypothetical protein